MFWASWGSHLLAAFGLQTFQLLATAITSEIYSMEAPCTASIQHLPSSPVHLSSFRGVRQEKLELQNHTISYASAERCTNEEAPQRSNHMHQGCNWYVMIRTAYWGILIQYLTKKPPHPTVQSPRGQPSWVSQDFFVPWGLHSAMFHDFHVNFRPQNGVILLIPLGLRSTSHAANRYHRII